MELVPTFCNEVKASKLNESIISNRFISSVSPKGTSKANKIKKRALINDPHKHLIN